MTTIIVLGSNGMAGHMISHYFEENGDTVINLKRPEFDVLSDWKPILDARLEGVSDNIFIINCIGLLKKAANSSPIAAIKVNSLFPHELAAYAAAKAARVIHLSTDCWNDLDYYGRSKRAGEILHVHTTIRTSIVGPELKDGTGLFHWFMKQKDNVDGFVDHIWDGVTTLQLAKTLSELISKGTLPKGIVELRTSKPVSKFELLNMFNHAFEIGIAVKEKHTEPVDKTSQTDILVPSLAEQVKELRSWMDSHSVIYAQYGLK